MNLLQYQHPNNPLKLLDDYLSSISSSTSTTIQGETADFCANDNDDSDAIINDATDVTDATTKTSSSSPEKQSTQIAQEQQQQQQQQEEQEEHLHNSVLRAANELFGNNISLLENSLALLEEQEQYQNNDGNNNVNNDDNNGVTIPPIRTIRARRSGRVAVLVRKQKKKSRSSYQHDKHSTTDDYYLCLLGRDKLTIDCTHSSIRTSQGTYLCTPQHRIGMHCTCRSFFHNVKGDNGRFKSNDERSPSRGRNSSSSSSNNKSNIVCKHLLAVILMPHLLPWRKDGVEEDIVDDKMFAKLVMKASIG